MRKSQKKKTGGKFGVKTFERLEDRLMANRSTISFRSYAALNVLSVWARFHANNGGGMWQEQARPFK